MLKYALATVAVVGSLALPVYAEDSYSVSLSPDWTTQIVADTCYHTSIPEEKQTITVGIQPDPVKQEIVEESKQVVDAITSWVPDEIKSIADVIRNLNVAGAKVTFTVNQTKYEARFAWEY